MRTKDEMFIAGVELAERFCSLNSIPMPAIDRLNPTQRNYHIGTCAYYRPTTIHIMVEKCAHLGFGGRAWSWPGYVVDRTPYGVIQHELGHHVDTVKTGDVTRENLLDHLFSKRIWNQSGEAPLTGYLGTDSQTATFWMEWFAENFRLFVTNPGLSAQLRPRFFAAVKSEGIEPLTHNDWERVLCANGAPSRIVDQARKKISAVTSLRAAPACTGHIPAIAFGWVDSRTMKGLNPHFQSLN